MNPAPTLNALIRFSTHNLSIAQQGL